MITIGKKYIKIDTPATSLIFCIYDELLEIVYYGKKLGYMSDYDIFGFRNYSTCSGSWNILYSILPCDRSDVTGCREGIRGSENCICHCTGNYFCRINSKRCIPDSLLESKEKAEKVEEPWEYVIK